jgi:hypothetical protein
MLYLTLLSQIRTGKPIEMIFQKYSISKFRCKYLLNRKVGPEEGFGSSRLCFVMFTLFGDNFAAIGQEPIEIFRKS